MQRHQSAKSVTVKWMVLRCPDATVEEKKLAEMRKL